MARETKIGMLVGLGFIVCFAVILENRGRDDRVGPQMPDEILAQSAVQTESVTPSVVERRARDYGRPRVQASTEASDRPERRPVRRQGAEPRARRPRPVPSETGDPRGRNMGAPAGRVADDAPREVAGTGEREAASGLRRVVFGEAESRPRSQRPSRSQTQPRPGRRVVQAGPTDPPLSLTATASQTEPKPDAEPESVAAAGQRYEIRKGDTLTRIAARHYGSGSKGVIDAIYNANRSVLSSPDALRVDEEIVLPAIAGGKALAPAVTEKPAAEAEPPADTSPAADPQPRYESYQVKKGDRYVTIAKEQLGSAARWREIAELNKDIFPDPARIQSGVRIRLPVDAGDDAQGTDS